MTKTILFADDELWFNEVMMDVLRAEGYDVVPVEDGTATVEYLESGKPVDLIILDIMMPTGERLIDPAHGRRTGVKVAEFIRHNLELKVPIIYFTVIEDQTVHNRIMKIEANAGKKPCFMVKAVLPSELVSVVKDCIESSGE